MKVLTTVVRFYNRITKFLIQDRKKYIIINNETYFNKKKKLKIENETHERIIKIKI